MRNDNAKKPTRLPGFGIPYLLPYLRPHRKYLWQMVVLGLLGNVMDILIPFFPYYAISHFIEKNSMDGIGTFVLVYFVLLLASIVMG